jgi:hypothetical protein
MANDKDFVVNGPVVVGKDTKVTVGNIAAGTVDLSTGNYFTDSPTGDYTYTFANPGDVQSFQIEATGGSAAVAETFSTDIWTGSTSAETITNGIDLAGDGGLTWFKVRSAAQSHILIDSVRGLNKTIYSNETRAEGTQSWSITYNSDGMTLPTNATDPSNGIVNNNGYDMVAWSFKKQTKFFDIVTWTGTGATSRAINHNLGSVPGMIIVKWYNVATDNWTVYHRGLNGGTDPEDYGIYLNVTNAAINESGFWNDTAPTSTQFTVGGSLNSGFGGGGQYIAYLFAHDTASDGLIQCGSYTGNGSTTGPVINLGWQPQWLLTKASSRTSDWTIVDSKRGVITGGNDARLHPQSNEAEANNADIVDFLADGFQPTNTGTLNNGNGETYIYMAIRSASAPAITWPTNIEWTAGSTPKSPAEGETDVYTFTTDDGGTTYTGIHSIDNAS